MIATTAPLIIRHSSCHFVDEVWRRQIAATTKLRSMNSRSRRAAGGSFTGLRQKLHEMLEVDSERMAECTFVPKTVKKLGLDAEARLGDPGYC